MSTLLISHPACLEHLTPLGHPERPDRLRAVERALEAEKFQMLARVEAPLAPLEIIALVHPMDYITSLRDATPKDGTVQLDADTSMSPGSFEAALRAAGGAIHAVDEVLSKKSQQRLRRHAPARPSCRDRAADGILPFRQRRHRRALCAKSARHRARRDRRFRRASRQRLAGDFLGRQDGDVLLDASDAAVSRHRRGRRERRLQHRGQRAAAARRRRGEIPRRLRKPDPAAACRIRAGIDRHFRRLRRPLTATRSPISISRKRISPGRRKRSWTLPTLAPAAASFRCSKAATTCRRSATRWPRTSPR